MDERVVVGDVLACILRRILLDTGGQGDLLLPRQGKARTNDTSTTTLLLSGFLQRFPLRTFRSSYNRGGHTSDTTNIITHSKN